MAAKTTFQHLEAWHHWMFLTWHQHISSRTCGVKSKQAKFTWCLNVTSEMAAKAETTVQDHEHSVVMKIKTKRYER